ncbi:MAG TPA: hypothetical protein VEK07_09735 [Polyangiaceae bacterium]|nr:hypothetical protein [Polyangiaceae bacterium]
MRMPTAFAACAAFTALASATGAAGCSSSDSCSSNDTTSPTYSCAMQSVDAGGCPAIAYPTAEPGAYALGCTATFAACSGFFQGQSSSPIQCACELYDLDGSSVPQWLCPN